MTEVTAGEICILYRASNLSRSPVILEVVSSYTKRGQLFEEIPLCFLVRMSHYQQPILLIYFFILISSASYTDLSPNHRKYILHIKHDLLLTLHIFFLDENIKEHHSIISSYIFHQD